MHAEACGSWLRSRKKSSDASSSLAIRGSDGRPDTSASMSPASTTSTLAAG